MAATVPQIAPLLQYAQLAQDGIQLGLLRFLQVRHREAVRIGPFGRYVTFRSQTSCRCHCRCCWVDGGSRCAADIKTLQKEGRRGEQKLKSVPLGCVFNRQEREIVVDAAKISALAGTVLPHGSYEFRLVIPHDFFTYQNVQAHNLRW